MSKGALFVHGVGAYPLADSGGFKSGALEAPALGAETSRPVRRFGDFVLVYLKRGSHLGSSPMRGELEAVKLIAREGLVRRGADEFQIRSDTLDGPMVWSERRDASKMIAGPFKS